MAERGRPGTWQYLAAWEPDGSLSLAATRAGLAVNDHDAGNRVMLEFPGWLHYVPGDDTWYCWDGRCHSPDRSGTAGQWLVDWARRYREMLRHARHAVANWVLRTVGDASPQQPSEAALRAAFKREWEEGGWLAAEKYAAGLMRSAGLASLERYMRTLCGTPPEVLEFGTGEATYLLNCRNGTVDLRTGRIRPHDPRDMLTYCLEARYDPALRTRARAFWAMLNRACADADAASYLLRVLGYSLLGDNREHLVPVLSGPAGSGKSKVLAIVSAVLGPLAHASVTDLVTHVRHGRNARTENSIRGKRLITLSELASSLKLDESQVKRLSGEPIVAVNQHYAKTEIRTPVTWLMVWGTNGLPSIANFDDGLRRRIVVIPGGEGLAPGEMIKDMGERVLAAERDAILALLVHACTVYFREGLPVPLSVELATARYVDEQDSVTAFLAECAEKGTYETGGAYAVPASRVWEAYRKWGSGLAYLGRNEFYELLGRQPGIRHEKDRGRFTGVRLNADWAMT